MNLTYTIVRSAKRKTLTLTVERDSTIVVKAPESLTDEAIDRVVQTKLAWLYDKLKQAPKYQARPHPPGKEIVNGESALYLGQEYPITLTEGAAGEIQFENGFLVPRLDRDATRKAFLNWYRKQANDIILPRLDRFSSDLGVVFARASIVDDRLRWGACTPSGNIRLNWRLIKAPMPVIDYVLVHELAHLLESNHTPSFWSIVRAKVVGADKSKNWLRDHGQLLEEEI